MPKEKIDIKAELIDFVKDFIIVLVFVLIVRQFFILPFQISGPSMLSSYYDKQFIIVDKFSYLDIDFIGKEWTPERWDVVVFKPQVSEKRKYFIKRIVGLPGERIKIEWGEVFLYDSYNKSYIQIDESGYLNEENNGNTLVEKSRDIKIFEVPEGQYFLLWDNRNHSTDSRNSFGSYKRTPFIWKDNIVGKVWIDLGYFQIRKFSFSNTVEGEKISTLPQFFAGPKDHEYDL